LKLNNAGQLAFYASLFGPDDNTSSGVWIANGAALSRVAQSGDPSPVAGMHFDDFTEPVLSEGGTVAFVATIGPDPLTDNPKAVFTGVPGGLRAVARVGDIAPGTDEIFDDFEGALLTNSLGQVAFTAMVSGSSGIHIGVWMTDPSGNLFLVGSDEQTLEIDGLNFQVTDVTPFSLSDDGVLAYAVELGPGFGGVFKAVVPEPATGMLMLGSVYLLAGARRRVRA